MRDDRWAGLRRFRRGERDASGGEPSGAGADPDVGTADDLPQWPVRTQANIWWLGVHPGAGEATMAALAAGTRAAEHCWPVPAGLPAAHHVVLLASLTTEGLTAAQRAYRQWAGSDLRNSVRLHGLVLLATPSRLRDREARRLQQEITRSVARVWVLPWVEAWQDEAPTPGTEVPRAFLTLCDDLALDLRPGYATTR